MRLVTCAGIFWVYVTADESCATVLEPVQLQVTTLKTDNDRLKADFAKLQTDLSSVTSQHTKCTSDMAHHIDTKTRAESTLTQCQADLQSKEAAVQKLTQSVASCSAANEKVKELVAIKQELETSKATSKTLEEKAAKIAGELEGVKNAHESTKQLLTAKTTELESKLGSCQASRSQDLQLAKEDFHRRLQAEEAKAGAAASKVLNLERDLHMATGTIFSGPQFWTIFDHSKTVVVAFAKSGHRRIVKLVGVDKYELIKLQLKLWYSSAESMTRPYRHQLMAVYDRHMKEHVHNAYSACAKAMEKPVTVVVNRFHRLLNLVDSYMDNIIRNLSIADPSMKEIFPESFEDRCYAFAFVSILMYCVSQAVQSTFAFVMNPVSYLKGGSGLKKRKGEEKAKRRLGTTKKVVESAKKDGTEPSKTVGADPSKMSVKGRAN